MVNDILDGMKLTDEEIEDIKSIVKDDISFNHTNFGHAISSEEIQQIVIVAFCVVKRIAIYEEKERLYKKSIELYREKLEELLANMRCIDGPNPADSYINDSINIIVETLQEGLVC